MSRYTKEDFPIFFFNKEEEDFWMQACLKHDEETADSMLQALHHHRFDAAYIRRYDLYQGHSPMFETILRDAVKNRAIQVYGDSSHATIHVYDMPMIAALLAIIREITNEANPPIG